MGMHKHACARLYTYSFNVCSASMVALSEKGHRSNRNVQKTATNIINGLRQFLFEYRLHLATLAQGKRRGDLIQILLTS